jgi:glutaredoxin-related protein
MFSGYSIPVPLKYETSKEIAKIFEEYIFKPFGIPTEISCDNAANLGGPEIRNLLKFYGVSLRRTVPYSPQSHSIVEISNKYLVVLMRIFAEQFNVSWTNVLTLAALTCNSVPRTHLKGQSPHYLIFLKEPMTNYDIIPNKNSENLDIQDHVEKIQNSKNYIRLVNEYLLKERVRQNQKIGLKYISYPKGSLILVKDNRPRANKKFFPVFYKCPEKVVAEFKSVIYTKDWLGRIRKHSKNNVRRSNNRTAELFENLPAEIKNVLGETFSEKIWEEISKNKEIPNYFLNLESGQEVGPILRGKLPEDTHLLEQDVSINFKDTAQDEESLDFESDVMNHLGELHKHTKLLSPNISLKDVPGLYRSLQEELLEKDIEGIIENEPVLEVNSRDTIPISQNDSVPEAPEVTPSSNLNAEILIENILPKGSKRVRFNFPKFQMPFTRKK